MTVIPLYKFVLLYVSLGGGVLITGQRDVETLRVRKNLR
jgi:hypothetical protein